MSRQRLIMVGAVLVGLSACSEPSNEVPPESEAPALVSLVGSDGAAMGTVGISEDSNGTTLAVELSGLSEGLHGVHLHEVGRCEGPTFESAGGHWNPSRKQHGRDNPDGAHVGDLSNLGALASGDGTATYLVAGVLLDQGEVRLGDSDGTALIVHASADDYRTDPSGNSGARIACAVIAAPR